MTLAGICIDNFRFNYEYLNCRLTVCQGLNSFNRQTFFILKNETSLQVRQKKPQNPPYPSF